MFLIYCNIILQSLVHHFSFHFGLLVLDLWLLNQKWFSRRRLSCWCYLGFLSVACVKGICFESKKCISVLLANRIKTLSFSATLNTLLTSQILLTSSVSVFSLSKVHEPVWLYPGPLLKKYKCFIIATYFCFLNIGEKQKKIYGAWLWCLVYEYVFGLFRNLKLVFHKYLILFFKKNLNKQHLVLYCVKN